METNINFFIKILLLCRPWIITHDEGYTLFAKSLFGRIYVLKEWQFPYYGGQRQVELNPFQQEIMKDKRRYILRSHDRYSPHQRMVWGMVTTESLMQMKEGQTFGLASKDGIKIFKLTEIRKYGDKK